MHIHDSPAIRMHDDLGDESHVPREHHEIDAMRAQLREQPVAAEGAAIDRRGRDVARARERERAGIRVIGEHERTDMRDVSRPLRDKYSWSARRLEPRPDASTARRVDIG